MNFYEWKSLFYYIFFIFLEMLETFAPTNLVFTKVSRKKILSTIVMPQFLPLKMWFEFLHTLNNNNNIIIQSLRYGQDVTQGQFLGGVQQVLIQFPSVRLVALSRLKNTI